jgi:hypothetical protein
MSKAAGGRRRLCLSPSKRCCATGIVGLSNQQPRVISTTVGQSGGEKHSVLRAAAAVGEYELSTGVDPHRIGH